MAAAECQRPAPEDFGEPAPAASAPAAPATTSIAPASTAEPAHEAPGRSVVFESTNDRSSPPPIPSTGDAGRCVLPTPHAAPPAVPPGPAPSCPPDPEGGPGKLPVVKVAFPEVGGVAVEAELVRSEHDTMRGLMYRKSMGADHGMLFDLTVRDDHKFWMHNTCIPLDLLYVDEDGLIAGIVENAPTMNDESRGVGCPSRWVLEVNAGWSRRHGVKAGQRLKLPR